MRMEIAGQRFGRLVAVEPCRMPNGRLKWRCVCDCGATTLVYASHLSHQLSTSCGCRKREVSSEVAKRTRTKHGMWRTSEYAIWQHMLQRCHGAASKHYANYGARGITVCDEWRADFLAFYNHIGPRPSKQHSVDRIKNDKGYEPGNVRWATPEEQSNNRRDNVRTVVAAEQMTATQLARRFGLGPGMVARRLRAGMTGDEVVAKPTQRRLTAELAREIRQDPRSYRQLASAFGVSKALIAAVKTRRLWKEAP